MMMLAQLEIFTPAAGGVIAVLLTLGTLWMKGDYFLSKIVERVREKQVSEEVQAGQSKIPQPLLLKLTAESAGKEDFENHLARNREAHQRFREEIEAGKKSHTEILREIARMGAFLETAGDSLKVMSEKLDRVSMLVGELRGRSATVNV